MSDDQIKAATTKIKNLADQRSINMDQVDAILMRLAAGPRTSSSQFVTVSTTHAAPELQVCFSFLFFSFLFFLFFFFGPSYQARASDLTKHGRPSFRKKKKKKTHTQKAAEAARAALAKYEAALAMEAVESLDKDKPKGDLFVFFVCVCASSDN